MDQRSPRQKPQQSNAFIKYSSMAIQMAVTIGLGVWGGLKLDEKFPNKAHAWTLTFSLISVIVAMYFAIKDLMKK